MMILRPEGLFGRWELDDLIGRGWRRLRGKRRGAPGSAEVEARRPSPAAGDTRLGEAGDELS
jgi:hypothetical protein